MFLRKSGRLTLVAHSRSTSLISFFWLLSSNKFPEYECSIEEVKKMRESGYRSRNPSDADLFMTRFNSERVDQDLSFNKALPPIADKESTFAKKTPQPPEKTAAGGSTLNSPDIRNRGVGIRQKEDEYDLEKQEVNFMKIIKDGFENENNSYFISNEYPLFFTLDVSFSEKAVVKKKPLMSFHSIFDKHLMREFICSANYIKEQLISNEKAAINKSAGEIEAHLGVSLSEWIDAGNDSNDNISFDAQRVDDEEDSENLSEVNIFLKFDILPDDVGIILDDHITLDDILQDSDRHINAKSFDKEFLNIFSNDIFQLSNENYDREEMSIQEKVESLVPTVIKMREGEHRNHAIKIDGNKRKLIKDKLTSIITFFVSQKLNLLRFVRPMNSEIIKEVMKCMTQIKCKELKIDLDLKEYTTTPELLLRMVKDEIKSNARIKFGYQEIWTGEEVFFAISTKNFKNFEFEKTSKEEEVKTMSKISNLSTRYILHNATRLINKDPALDKIKSKNSSIINVPYKPYGSFEIA